MAEKVFEDKVAVITGSSMGLGKVIAKEFLKEGAKIVINGRNEERLKKAKSELLEQNSSVEAITGDVTTISDCKNLVDKTIEAFGRIDILINNVGISSRGFFESYQPEVFLNVMNINYLSAVYTTKMALPFIKKTKGSIIYISSADGIRGLPTCSAYSPPKMALTAFAETLKLELYNSGVFVGINYPSFIENDPGKNVLNPDGALIPTKKLKNFRNTPQPIIARIIIRQIKRRKFKVFPTPLVKFNLFLNKLAPGMANLILLRSMKKIVEL